MAKREEFSKFKREESDIEKRVISIRRVTKVIKGGRAMNFSVNMVVGDRKGKVGHGSGKAADTTNAIEKAFQNGKKHMFQVCTENSTIPHEVRGKFGKSTVLMMPAADGTGIIAGGAVRAVVALSGIKDIVCKTYGSRNSINVVKATLLALQNLKTKELVAKLRGKAIEEI